MASRRAGLPFTTLDVFTSERFTGNPLAVVRDADALDPATMQRIAREFNLSETVFVQTATDVKHRARLRIFTPARELPFAGHPTVGTAVLLGCLGGGGGGEQTFVLEEIVGAVPCRVRCDSDTAGRAEFDLPRASARVDAEVNAAAMLRAIGLTPEDGEVPGLPVEHWSAGNPFTMLPVRNLDAMRRIVIDLSRFDIAFGGGLHAAAFVFCRETAVSGHAFHARMFAPGMGPLEDPATGSAAAAFTGYVVAHDRFADGTHVLRLEQGYEMGRPSLIDVTLQVRGGALTNASIGGEAVVVASGTL
jgi:trans-2,3-dihydro-3-hydroxyanthranilate isomerase